MIRAGMGAPGPRRAGRGPVAPVALPTLVACTAFVALFAMAGCANPFRPAQPEPPVGEDATLNVDIDFSSPEGLLTTLATAVIVKNQGNAATAYRSAFADSEAQGFGFGVDFDPDVQRERTQAGKPLPPGWGIADEAAFFNYFVGLYPGEYSLLWTLDGADPIVAPDRAIRHRIYRVTVIGADFNETTVATGRATLEMRLVPGTTGNWVITRWTDTALDASSGPLSFSRLRIDSYNRAQ